MGDENLFLGLLFRVIDVLLALGFTKLMPFGELFNVFHVSRVCLLDHFMQVRKGLNSNDSSFVPSPLELVADYPGCPMTAKRFEETSLIQDYPWSFVNKSAIFEDLFLCFAPLSHRFTPSAPLRSCFISRNMWQVRGGS